MIICFGISWPLSIYKSYHSRSTKGKSLPFLLFIFIGYTSGIISKIVTGNITYVLYFYFLNSLMVGIDISLFIRNWRLQMPDKSDSA
ncbi:MAG: hypothetical protein ACYCYI_07190 [Saccharofermentanales bacterium]